MIHDPKAEIISVRSKARGRKRTRAYRSASPWAGFTSHDKPRSKPLPVCPHPRCRRDKTCLAAHDGLYCRRTYFSPAEIAEMQPKDPLAQAIAALPTAGDRWDFEDRGERIKQAAELRLAHHEKMTARWKAGIFDDLFGKYSPRGVLIKPPPKAYVDLRPSSSGARNGGRQGRAGDV